MDKNAVIDIIKRYEKALESRGVRSPRIVLFGSFSRGDYHEDSDIDLVVISESFEGMGYWDRIEVPLQCHLRSVGAHRSGRYDAGGMGAW